MTVTPTDDSVYEGVETVEFKVQRSLMMPTGAWTAGTMTLVDNEQKPVVSVVAVDDAVEGGASGTFRFTRTGDTSTNLTVTYTVRTVGPGMATPGDDYTALSGSVTILAGNASADVSVAADDDETEEIDEKVDVLLQTGGGYLVGDPMSAQVSIRDIQNGVVAGRAWGDADEDGIQDENDATFSPVDAGSDDSIDSDASPLAGTTATFVVIRIKPNRKMLG